MIRSVATLALLILIAGCSRSADESREAAPQDVESALSACTSGKHDAGIEALDLIIEAKPKAVDALAARGICKWARFGVDSSRADIKGAFEDLNAAIESGEGAEGGSLNMTLDRLYSHRAFISAAMNPGEWGATIEDLDRAARINPGFPTHILDRGVARLMSGDSAGARADFLAFVEAAPNDTARVQMVKNMIAEIDGDGAWVPASE